MLPVRAKGQSIHVRAMRSSVLPVRANGQSIHVRMLRTSVLPVRANGQSIHVHTMRTSASPVRANGQSIHVRTRRTSVLPVRANGQSKAVKTQKCTRSFWPSTSNHTISACGVKKPRENPISQKESMQTVTRSRPCCCCCRRRSCGLYNLQRTLLHSTDPLFLLVEVSLCKIPWQLPKTNPRLHWDDQAVLMQSLVFFSDPPFLSFPSSIDGHGPSTQTATRLHIPPTTPSFGSLLSGPLTV